MFDTQDGALVYTAKTAVLTWCVVAALTVLEVTLSLYTGSLSITDTQDHEQAEALLPQAFALLVVHPIFENLLLAGLIEFLLIFSSSRYTIAGISAVIFGVLHYFENSHRFIAGFLGFGVMSYSYLLWYESSFKKRYAITVAQHALSNGLTCTLAVALA